MGHGCRAVGQDWPLGEFLVSVIDEGVERAQTSHRHEVASLELLPVDSRDDGYVHFISPHVTCLASVPGARLST
jgi:hypothetical protein